MDKMEEMAGEWQDMRESAGKMQDMMMKKEM